MKTLRLLPLLALTSCLTDPFVVPFDPNDPTVGFKFEMDQAICNVAAESEGMSRVREYRVLQYSQDVYRQCMLERGNELKP